MRFLGMPYYYVGLLTAAQWHGASHFAIQETQVMAPRQMRPIQVGREKIRFFMKTDAVETPVETRNLDNGPIRVSTPEATAADLVDYIAATGGLNLVTTALAELAKKLKAGTLQTAVANGSNIATAQRLGYFLEQVADDSLTTPLARWVAKQHPRALPLDAKAPVKGAPFNERWRLWVNASVEASL
jgi:predicted transcriptional regulator of viral defense system